MNKTRWSDVTEAELAATGKVRRGSVAPQPVGAKLASEGTTLAPTRSKYRNVKTVVDGIRFDSRREADYWMGLRAREQAGEITELSRQVHFPLYAPEMDDSGLVKIGNLVQVAEYVADFTYREGGRRIVVDAKARHICPYPLKRKWLELQQGIEILEV